MKFSILRWAVLCVACLGTAQVLAQTRELGGTGELLDGIAAVVNDGVVLKSALATSTGRVMANLREKRIKTPANQRRPLPPRSEVRSQVLDQLILKQVQLQRAKRLGITVSDQALNQAMSKMAQNLGISFAQLPAAMAAQGIDYGEYRQQSRDDAIIRELVQRDVMSRINVSSREIEHCLKKDKQTRAGNLEYNISHILVSIPPSPTQSEIQAAQAKLETIYNKLAQGVSFSQLAVVYSDANTALKGGHLGWRKGSALPTVFANIVPKLKPGEYTKDPVQTASGYQIVELNDVRGAPKHLIKEQYQVRHILLKTNAVMDDDAVRQRLLDIRRQIEGGEAFGPIADAVSADSASAAHGGDLGWITLGRGQFPPKFEKEVASLKVGEISQPFKTNYGWHLAEVTDKRMHDMTGELNREQCVRQVRNSKVEEAHELWLRRLRDQAYVSVKIH